jgi:hypothetical protein
MDYVKALSLASLAYEIETATATLEQATEQGHSEWELVSLGKTQAWLAACKAEMIRRMK